MCGIVFFGWDANESSKKIEFAEPVSERGQSLTSVKVRDGSGFKTVLGDALLPAGGKYFYQVQIKQGSLIKIGFAADLTVNPDQVTAFSYLYLGILRQ